MEKDVYADGILGFYWRKPPTEEEIVEALKTFGFDFCYRFVPDGSDHKEKDCEHCDNEGPLPYGGICRPVPLESDWKIVKVS